MLTSPSSNGRLKVSRHAKDDEWAALLGTPPEKGKKGARKAARRKANGRNGGATHPPTAGRSPTVHRANGENGGWTAFVITMSPALNGGNGGGTLIVTPGMARIGDVGRVAYVVACGHECIETQAMEESARDGAATDSPPLTSCAAPECAAPNAVPGAPDRDARGRFVKGNRGGPGNPFNRRLAAMRKALFKAVTPMEIRALAALLLTKARDGDLAAMKLLFLYGIGRPTDPVNPDILDHDEFSLFKQSAEPADLLDVVNRVPHSLMCELFRAMVPIFADLKLKQLTETIGQPAAKAGR